MLSIFTKLEPKRQVLIVIWLAVVMVSCTPKDQAIAPGSIGKAGNNLSYAGFSGLDSAQTVGATKVKLSWTPSVDPSVVGYKIYDTSLMFSPQLIKTVTAPASQVTLANLTSEKYYSFRARAVNSLNIEDTNVNDVGAIPYGGVISSTVISGSTASVSYNDASNADFAKIYCKSTLSPVESLYATVTNVLLTSTTLTALTAGNSYTCRAVLSVGGFEDNNTVTTTFTPMGQATQLAFSMQPASASAGVALPTQPVVTIKDANGNTVSSGPDSVAVVTLTLSTLSPTSGTVRGTASVTAYKGVATFTGVYLQEAGQKILTASKSDTSTIPYGSAPFSADSSPFTISPGAVSATNSLISISPVVPPNPALVANGAQSYSVIITLMDQYSNPVSGIKPVFTTNYTGDTLTQPIVNTNASGVAIGSISTTVADTTVVPRSLSISSPTGLSSVVVAAPFVPGAATKLAYIQQPTNSPAGALGLGVVTVAVQDAQGNVVTSGTAASSLVVLSIASNVNGATLMGTISKAAVGGVATFSDLGIDKIYSGYKLAASSGGYTPAYSNAFNIIAGTPKKIILSGASSFSSGSCSLAYTLQLQDQGGNPSGAVSATTINFSGLSGASVYANSACSGSALGTSTTFTANTNTKTIYFKDLKAEALSITASDTSSLLTSANLNLSIGADKIGLVALMPSPPAAANTPMTVTAGKCSPPIVITTYGDNALAGPIFSTASITVSGVVGSNATLYSNNTCTTPLTATNVPLAISSGGVYTTNVYLKDNVAENLSLSIFDNGGIMTAITGLQSVSVTPSNLAFTGPTSVVAGLCSTVYTITLKDANGTTQTAAANLPLVINGLSGSTTGAFYLTSNCTGTSTTSTITIPQGSSALQLYFKDTAAESLNFLVSDPASNIANSASINMKVSPSALRITAPSLYPSPIKTEICAGPFTVETLDGAPTPNVANAVNSINIVLSGGGTGAQFYSDVSCLLPTTGFTIASGTSSGSFYYMSHWPNAGLTLAASDNAAVLTQGTLAYTVTGAPAWIGTIGSNTNTSGNQLWFRSVPDPVQARFDAPRGVMAMTFDSTKRWLYMYDTLGYKLLKYDYTNKKYIGWLGTLNNSNQVGGLGITGSSYDVVNYPQLPSANACKATISGAQTPGWCVGGYATAVFNGVGSLPYSGHPGGIATNTVGATNYLYFANFYGNTVQRYNADSGAFDGWIGRVAATPSGVGTGGPSTCTSTAINAMTPGWCKGGTPAIYTTAGTNSTYSGATGELTSYYTNATTYSGSTRAIEADSQYIYVGGLGAIKRFLASDGSYQGWIGYISATTGGLSDATGGAGGCAAASASTITPGWCMGGVYAAKNPYTAPNGGVNSPVSMKIIGTTLFVLHADTAGTISKYDKNTGAFLGLLPTSHNWANGGVPASLATDGTNLFVTDQSRVIQVDMTGTLNGWIGKVANGTAMSNGTGNPGTSCTTLVTNANTPGWCVGGTPKYGVDEQSFEYLVSGIEFDGVGNLITSEYPPVGTWGGGGGTGLVKQWNAVTGAYIGTMSMESRGITSWSGDSTTVAQGGGTDDESFYAPRGSWKDPNSNNLYVVDALNGRIKKIDVSTGTTLGWIGAIATSPTGGAAGCVGSAPMGASPGWCLGSKPMPQLMWNTLISQTVDGIMYDPVGITGDGTYLYVIDLSLARIQRFKISDGSYWGWIGRIAASPVGSTSLASGGSAACAGAAVGTYTPGWCLGGLSANGYGADGNLWAPTGIHAVGGKLYVVDANDRISKYDAASGAFNGWIGVVATAPTSGCTTADISGNGYKVSTSGWCMGGTASPFGAFSNGAGGASGTWSTNTDKGGGFTFYGQSINSGNLRTNIISDSAGTYLYVPNSLLGRIDKIRIVDGVFMGSVIVNPYVYTNTWQATGAPTQWPYWVNSIWSDGTNIYGIYSQVNNGAWSSYYALFKMDLASGTILGWRGAINPGVSITGGDPGCVGATGTTPGWCKSANNGVMTSHTLSGYNTPAGISGDANFIYVSDEELHRVIRYPK